MFNVVLHQPQIPPNTGNIIRLCANTGCALHLIAPLGFTLEHSRLRRAGLDYHEFAAVRVHAGIDAWLDATAPKRVFAMSTRATRGYHETAFAAGDSLLFGSETSGLPEAVLARWPEAQRLRLPMRPDNRSLNLSNAVAVVVFEAWRQHGFAGAAPVSGTLT